MKWKKGTKTPLIEDRRGSSPHAPRSHPPRRRLGVGGVIILILVVLSYSAFRACFGTTKPMRSTTRSTTRTTSKSRTTRTPRKSVRTPAPHAGTYGDTVLDDDELTDFLAFLIEDTNELWKETFESELHTRYSPVKMVLFEHSTRTGCGRRSARGGPAYCPADRKMYVPPSFYAELSKELDAPGDFAQAIVVAHEAAHHVQLGLGISADLYAQIKKHPSQSQDLKIRHELQADCFAGIWAHSVKARGLLEMGDVEEALQAAAAIGDDALQRHAGIPVDDRKWSHGSSAMRVRWFKKGMRSGDVDACDTFSARTL